MNPSDISYHLDGNLTEEDEEKYIEKIIYEPMIKIYKQKEKNENDNNQENTEQSEENKKEDNDEEFIRIHKLAKDLIVSSQKFIRKKNDISSVSLREIRRFNIFYGFFFDYFKKKKDMNLDLLENKQLDK